jgi:hypothetical protein
MAISLHRYPIDTILNPPDLSVFYTKYHCTDIIGSEDFLIFNQYYPIGPLVGLSPSKLKLLDIILNGDHYSKVSFKLA